MVVESKVVSMVELCTCVLGSDMEDDAEPEGVLVSFGDGEGGVGRGDELDIGGISTDIESSLVFVLKWICRCSRMQVLVVK